MTLLHLRKFRLPKILDERGNLSVFENDGYFPFRIEWITWFCSGEDTWYDTRQGSSPFDVVVIVLAGSLKLAVKEGIIEEEILLDDSCNCICLPADVSSRLTWAAADTCAFITANALPEDDRHLTHFFPNSRKPSLEQYELLSQ